MKSKMSPFLTVGFLALIVGNGLNLVFRFVDVDWDYGLLAICINVFAIILLLVGIYKTTKTKK